MKKSLKLFLLLMLTHSTIYCQNPQINNNNNNNFKHYIGELFGGGIIVYLQKDQNNIEHGLICSLKDLSSSCAFSNVTDEKIGTNSEDRNDGRKNINGILNQPNHKTSAAKLCDDYANEGFGDWYLPSISELKHCYNSKKIIDKVLQNESFGSESYWCSTEDYYGNFIYFLNFIDGSGNESHLYFKNDILGVRAVRQF